MSLRNWTPKIAALTLLGSVITVLLIISVTTFFRGQFKPATWCLVVAFALALGFFRHRKIALSIIGLSLLFVNAGLHALFHPTTIGIAVSLVSGFLLYALAVWGSKRYPHLPARDWKALFDRDPK
jgi:hypothetical protein